MEIRDSMVDNLGGTDYNFSTSGLEGESSADMHDKLLTIQKLCELLRAKKSYVYWLTYQKKIPYIKMMGHLRFRKSAIDECLNSQEIRISMAFNRLVKKAGLENVTLHTLRHTFASQLVMAGVPLRDVQELMGHRSFETTLQYAHLSEDHVKQQVLKLPFATG